MAVDNTAIGSALIIPDSLLKNLGEVDKKIRDIQDASRATASVFNNSFASMSMGLKTGILTQLQQVINQLGSVGQAAQTASSATQNMGSGLGTAAQGATNLGTSVTGVVEAINRMIGQLQQTGQIGSSSLMAAKLAADKLMEAMQFKNSGNIATIKSEIDGINEKLKSTENLLTREQQQGLVERKRILQEELKEAERTQNERAVNLQRVLDRMVNANEAYSKKEISVRKSVEKEIQKDNENYLKSLEERARRAQEYQMRIQELESKKKSINSKAQVSVEAEIQKEQTDYLKSLERQAAAEQEYQARMQSLKNKRAEIEASANKAVEAEIKQENDKYLSSLNERIKQEQDYQQRMARLKEKRKEIDKAASASVEAEIKSEKEAYMRSLSERIRQQQEYNQRMAELKAQQAENERKTYKGAMSLANSATSINERTRAIKYLTEARNALSKTDADYTNKLATLNAKIKELNAANRQAIASSQELNNSHRKLMDTAGQLQRAFALMFSVSQIRGYIGQIAQVRGEFELQQKSLQAIIQDKQQADTIFNQTMALALDSPFRAKELITFTKQLAAYRIESDKLYDTTKRLADVSAGLGVSMDRLALAYGQVKAAAYLRGSEVRQFTEAGVNMYGELQRYFEEVKGEAYTTAQIVDMISKRKVTFEDVEQIFKRMTDQGGLFYNMQHIQVETLSGKIGKFKDAVDQMQNAIGKDNEGLFKGGLDFAIMLTERWRDIASILKTVVAGYATYKTVSAAMWLAEQVYMTKNIALHRTKIAWGLKSIIQKRQELAATRANTTATTAAASAQRGLNAAVASNPYGAILSIVAVIATSIYEAVQEANRLKKALDGIAAEGAFESVKSANDYVKLASVVADSTKSYEEHNKALSELKTKYADILPEQYLNQEGIKALNGNYEKATETIHKYINAKTKEKMIEEVGQDANKEMYSNQQKAAKEIAKIIEEQNGIKVSWNEISIALNEVQEKLVDGTIKSVKQLREETEKVVEVYTGLGNIDLSDYFTTLSGSSFGGANGFKFEKIQIENSFFKDWFESAKSYFTLLEGIENRFNRNSLSMTAQRYQKQKEEVEKMISNAMSAYDVLRNSQKENTKVTKDELENAKKLVQKFFDSIGLKVKVDSGYIRKLFNDSFFFEEEKTKATKAKLNQLFDKLSNEAKKSGDESGKLWLQKFQEHINGLDLSPLQESIKKFLLGINGNEDIQSTWNIRSGETEEDYKKRIKDEIDTRNEIIRKSESAIYPEFGQDTSKVKSELEELNRLYKELGGDNNKKRPTSERDIWQERISVLKEMQSRYEKLNKLIGENRAIEETRSAFSGALKFTKMDEVIKAENIIPTKQGMIDALEKLLSQIPNDAKNAAKRTGLEKEIAELKIGIQQDYLKEQLEKTKDNIEAMFKGLDLHQKLKDAGLTEEEVKQLFPGLAKSLDDVQAGIEERYKKNFPKGEYLKEGTDANKQYIKDIQELDDKRVKEQEDLVIELTKKYKTQLSDQLQLDKWYVEERSKIELANLTPEQKEQYRSNLKKDYDKKTDENTWKSFKESDEYIKIFENLDYTSTSVIENTIKKLEGMKDSLKNLPPDQLKVIVELIEKLKGETLDRNPIKGIERALNDLKNAKPEDRQKAIADLGTAFETASSKIQSFNSAFGEVSSMLSSFGINVPEEISGALSGMSQAFSGASEFETGLATRNPLQMITGGLKGLAGIGNMIGNIFGFGNKDKKLQKEIENQQRIVERLERAYEKLKVSMDEAWSAADVIKANKDTEKNIEAQISAYQSMIAAESDKKDSDDDAIREWQNKIEDLQEALKELEEQTKEAFGGFGSQSNYKSSAQEFADAWVDAFNESEDTLKALEDTFDNYFNNMLKKQLMQRAAQKYLQPIFDALDNAVSEGSAGGNNGRNVTEDEIEQIKRLKDIQLKEFDEYAKTLMEILGVRPGSSSELSKLQQGIQSITESTGQALESILNSIRFFVAQQSSDVTIIRNLLQQSSEMEISTDTNTPILNELIAQTNYLKEIRDMFRSIYKNTGHTKMGAGIKVFMD